MRFSRRLRARREPGVAETAGRPPIRRRSASSQENDARLLEAALDEIAAVGVDRIGMSGVARRASLTTGALYGRYENVERARGGGVDRAGTRHALRLPRHGDARPGRRRLLRRTAKTSSRELSAPSPTTLAALELLATARRIDETRRGRLRRCRGMAAALGRRPARAPPAAARAGRVHVGSAVGRAPPRAPPARVRPTGRQVRAGRAVVRAALRRTTADRFVPETTGAVRADVGDAAQNALIDSVSAIIARVGFERATSSRIARRAGLTSGAIYGRYDDQGRPHRPGGRRAARPATRRRPRGEHVPLHRTRCRRPRPRASSAAT